MCCSLERHLTFDQASHSKPKSGGSGKYSRTRRCGVTPVDIGRGREKPGEQLVVTGEGREIVRGLVWTGWGGGGVQ